MKASTRSRAKLVRGAPSTRVATTATTSANICASTPPQATRARWIGVASPAHRHTPPSACTSIETTRCRWRRTTSACPTS